MHCRRTRRLLVAHLDAELAPSHAARVEEHLERCAACTAARDRLAATTPRAPDLPLADVELHRAQLRILHALDREPPPASPQPGAIRTTGDAWELFRGEVRVPRGLLVLYAAALVAALGWGVSGALMSPPESPPSASSVDADPTPVRASLELPPPAAYTPRDGWF